jgi:formylglycine-generating enzyme required for sulfatase activity
MKGTGLNRARARAALAALAMLCWLSVFASLVTGCTRSGEQKPAAVAPIAHEGDAPSGIATKAMAPAPGKPQPRTEVTKPPSGLSVETNSIGMKMVLIPAGEFTMGSSDGDSDEKPPHKVRITKPFYLGQYEVTVGQFRQFVNESGFQGVGDGWKTAFPSQTDDCPVVNVSWNDAEAFCDWLWKKEGKEYRLPTEAEWEYACRAGMQTTWSFGDNESELGDYAWYRENSGERTHPLGHKKPNAWGLYGMHGNAWEWCADWYASDYYASSPADDPKGPSFGTLRVARGGSWNYPARLTRSPVRRGGYPHDRVRFCGFRVARTP